MEMLLGLRTIWNNKEELSLALIGICERQFELSELIAADEANLNSVFVQEREESYKGTDSLARARAKNLVGNNKTRYEYEFQVLDNLIQVVISRISQLSALR